jgi:hypothetical protein
MPFRLSCPSCNTSFALAELPADRRTPCPRCGDVFPVRNWEETDEKAVVPTAGAPGFALRDRARWSVQRAVAVALAMGLVGLVAGLAVYYSRDSRPKRTPDSDTQHSLAAIPPVQLAGLGYLPADTSVVFAVQPGPVLAYAERTKQDPRELLIKAGIPRQAYDAFANIGLTLQQIDHIAGGVSDWGLGPRLSLVIILRHSLADEEEFLKLLKATKRIGTQVRYKVQLAGLPLDLTLARVSPTAWVFGFDAKKDLEAVDRGGYGAGGKQFAPALAEMIAEHVAPDAAAWVATSEERWAEKPLIQFAVGQFAGKKEWVAVLAKGRALAAGISLGGPPRLRLFVKAADEATGQQLRAYFARRAATDEMASHGGAGELAFFDAPMDPSTIFATLQQMLSDAVKP